MIGERENKHTNTDYGTLHMQSYAIDGNEINAFYDSSDNLVFVLDNTINASKPNVLLIINPDGDRKWDEILSDDYDVDLETIRPKQDNKYQKLDIEYSGLNVYEDLINAYNAGDSLDTELDQLNVLRESAVRHSAMVRLSVANEIISKTNSTIVKTQETIVRLQERIKTLRAKLATTKKEIGRVSTKQSASTILKLESQIEALNEKLKRAKKRLESAQKRLEIATVDAELASELLNQPSRAIKSKNKTTTKGKSVMVAKKHEVQKVEPEYEESVVDIKEEDNDDIGDTTDDTDKEIDDDNAVKPLFNQDPQILDEDIAFKPISMESVPAVPELTEQDETPENKESDDFPTLPELPEPEKHEEIPYLNDVFVAPENKDVEQPIIKEKIEEQVFEQPVEKPVLESLAPINNIPELSPNFKSVIEEAEIVEKEEQAARVESTRPVPPQRQSEPVIVEETETVVDTEPAKDVVLDNRLIAPMTESTHVEIVGENDSHKPTIIYYLLLIILIALSVFTLWLYQKNVDNSTSPVLTANVEKTTVLKKAETPKKVVEPVVGVQDDENVFLDEQQSSEVKGKTKTDSKEDIKKTSEPVVVDAVPVRVVYSGSEPEEEKNIVSEEEVLANKPVYETTSKHDEMFIVANPDVQDTEVAEMGYNEVDVKENNVIENQNVEYAPENVDVIDGNDADVEYFEEDRLFYDDEETAYQAEQNELDYEE